MTKEEFFFIQLLSDFVEQKETKPLYDDLDWNTITHLAKIHQVGGIVFHQCKRFIPAELQSVLYSYYMASIYSYANYSSELKILEQSFHENDIDMFTVKGLEIASYYPCPALRTMGDMDIIVQTSKRKKADDILRQFHYENHSQREDKEWEYFKNGNMIELHDCLIYNQVINKDRIEQFFNNCWIFVKDGKLDVSFHFLFILEHLRKHLLNYGAGFRQFIDIAVMSKNEAALNWEWINEKLNELDLVGFSSVCFGFIQKWFGIKVPINPIIIDDDFYKEATEKVLSNGVFGFDNTENVVNSAVNAARNSKLQSIGMIKGALRYILPSYQDLSDKKFYPYLKGKPYLLPISWIHRLVRGIWNFKRAKSKMRLKFTSFESIKKRDEYLKKWKI